MEPRHVVLVDLSAIFRSVWHASGDEPTSAAFEGTLAGVRRAASSVDDALVAVCVDGKNGSASRRAMSPDYKIHREKQPEALWGLLDRVKERLKADGYLLLEHDGFEADDVIASASYWAHECGHRVVIATHDKDMCQLVSPEVTVLSTRTWDVMDEAKVRC